MILIVLGLEVVIGDSPVGCAGHFSFRVSFRYLFVDFKPLLVIAHSFIIRFSDPKVGGVGGSYGNMRPDSLLAGLIHEEIIARHRSMTGAVMHLGSYNVVYPTRILKELHGFDEHRFNGPGKPGAEDADLAYRVHEAGYILRFVFESRVGHFHPTSLRRYLRSQRIHGYWRVSLHRQHPRTGTGDTYSSIIDHLQPPLAMLLLVLLPTLFFAATLPIVPGLLLILALMQIPMTLKLARATGRWRFLAFAPMSMVRAFARGIGLTAGVLAALSGGGTAPRDGPADRTVAADGSDTTSGCRSRPDKASY